ncbi:hypothetical protein [Parvibaculum sp.]|uniref:hypothetical protein n=1 Tax=Parvibaculum sp. TaxID=2024848 RepID=UPI001B23D294|nr:hypothetical protein [Parvibaculum sp.]MBO6669400.1 hypothetical protein [Parvibaculum sp.]MBO6692803.1 hypothetical protein [Parvibaculum sp.]MBO6715101.1 hypothetical protein [Parvibaculum sp.]
MWPFGKSRNPAAELVFKGGKEFFEYQCKFGHTEIREKEAIVAIVVDAKKEFGTSQSVAIQPNGIQKAVIRVASDDGGFIVFADTVSSNGKRLKPGDVVFWVPVIWNKEIAEAMGDERQGWIGPIVAKLKPELLPGGDWSIACRY